jgi:two-component system chemotaxis response regulator CheY
MKILVVDDSPTMRRILIAQLGQLGYGEVEEADNGQVALERLKSRPFDFVLTDWNMPFMDGRSMVMELRQTPGIDQLPVVMVTTRNTKTDVIEALKAGVNNYVVKPFKPSDLGKKIDAVLAAGAKTN